MPQFQGRSSRFNLTGPPRKGKLQHVGISEENVIKLTILQKTDFVQLDQFQVLKLIQLTKFGCRLEHIGCK
jgi:hypothetical protein